MVNLDQTARVKFVTMEETLIQIANVIALPLELEKVDTQEKIVKNVSTSPQAEQEFTNIEVHFTTYII